MSTYENQAGYQVKWGLHIALDRNVGGCKIVHSKSDHFLEWLTVQNANDRRHKGGQEKKNAYASTPSLNDMTRSHEHNAAEKQTIHRTERKHFSHRGHQPRVPVPVFAPVTGSTFILG